MITRPHTNISVVIEPNKAQQDLEQQERKREYPDAIKNLLFEQ